MEISASIINCGSVTLTPVCLDGLPDFHEYSTNRAFYRHLEFAPFETINDSKAYLEKLVQRSASPCAQYWFINLSDNGKVVGSIGLHSFEFRRKSVELGYGVSPDYWGKGIFTEAAGTLVEYAFGQLSLHRIVARTSAKNKPSIKGLEKIGFKSEGVMRDYYKSESGEWFDAELLAMLSTDK